MKKGFDLFIQKGNVKNEMIDKIYVIKRVFCSEIDIRIWMKGFINPISYTVDKYEIYPDNLLFTNYNQQERRFKKLMNETDKRRLILKTWDMLESDDCIPWIGQLIDSEIDDKKC